MLLESQLTEHIANCISQGVTCQTPTALKE